MILLFCVSVFRQISLSNLLLFWAGDRSCHPRSIFVGDVIYGPFSNVPRGPSYQLLPWRCHFRTRCFHLLHLGRSRRPVDIASVPSSFLGLPLVGSSRMVRSRGRRACACVLCYTLEHIPASTCPVVSHLGVEREGDSLFAVLASRRLVRYPTCV